MVRGPVHWRRWCETLRGAQPTQNSHVSLRTSFTRRGLRPESEKAMRGADIPGCGVVLVAAAPPEQARAQLDNLGAVFACLGQKACALRMGG
jgi:hypothetical protein